MKVPPSAYLPAVAGRCVGGGFALHSANYRTVVSSFGDTSAVCTDCLQKKLLRNHLQLLPFPSFSSLRFQIPFFPHISAEKNCSKKGKSAMIEAKASGPRERKETVFNEKKTVRDFGRSDAGQQLRHECDGGRICTGTVHGLRSGESNHHGHAGTDIPRRNWGISMASPPFWKWMGSSSRT